MAIRVIGHLDLDPAAPGVASVSDEMVARRANAIAINVGGASEEQSFLYTNIISAGPVSGRVHQLWFNMFYPEADTTDVDSIITNFEGADIPNKILPYNSEVPGDQPSRLEIHYCTHDGAGGPCPEGNYYLWEESV